MRSLEKPVRQPFGQGLFDELADAACRSGNGQLLHQLGLGLLPEELGANVQGDPERDTAAVALGGTVRVAHG